MKITSSAVHTGTSSPWSPGWEGDAWRVTLTTDTDPARTMTVDYHTGTGQRRTSQRNGPPAPGAVKIRGAEWTAQDLGHDRRAWPHGGRNAPGTVWAIPPEPGDVLETLTSDAASVDSTRDKWEWFAELGFEMGSTDEARRHERAYLATVQQAEELRRFLGDHYDAALYNAPEDGWSSITGPTVTITKETTPDA